MRETVSKKLISSSRKVDKEKRYWLNKLSGELVKTSFPYDYSVRDSHNDNLAGVEFRLPGDISRRLIRLSGQSDKNLYLVLLAVLTLLLRKYTGNKDIIILAPIFKQKVEGEFINTVLAIRNRLDGGETFKELLLMVRNNVKEANENLNYPLESLLYHLDISPAENGFPLSETAILLDNIHSRKYVENIDINVLISFLKVDRTIKGHLEYKPRFYKKETIKKYIDHYINLLGKSIQNADMPVNDLEVLAGEERQKLLVDFNATAGEYPEEKTIRQLFEDQVAKTPGNVAVVAEEDGFVSLRFRELNEKANQLAGYLREKGVKRDSLVGIMMNPSLEVIVGIMAVLKAGAAYLPVDPEYFSKRTVYMLHDSRVGLLLTRPQFAGLVELQGEIVNIEEPAIYRGNKGNLENVSCPESGLYTIYTSGTSGRPKGVLIKNKNLVNYVAWCAGELGICARDKTILTSSFAFDLGYTSLYAAVLNGGELHILSTNTYMFPEKLLDYIKEKEISFLKMTPSFFSVIVNNPEFSAGKCAKLRLILLGGEPINTKDVEHARRRCSHLQVMNHYGPTETTIGSIAQFIDFNNLETYKQVPTIGKPIFNTRVYILDKDEKLMPIGVAGEICIAGDGVGRGYLNRPALTAAKFASGGQGGFFEKPPPCTPRKTFVNCSFPLFRHSIIPGVERSGTVLYRTGDAGRWLDNGYIEFLGRIDQQVKIRGYRIEPGEIETQLLKHKAIKEAAVLPRKDNKGNSCLCAYIVPCSPGVKESPGTAQPLDLSELREYLSAELTDFMIPSYFVELGKIPLTPNGKIDRKALPEPDQRIPVGEYAAPKDAVEKKLVEIWSEVLGVEKEMVGIEHDFFDLGGSSLNIIMLISRIYKEFGVEVAVNKILEFPTIKELSQHLKSRKFVDESVVLLNQPAEKKIFCFPSSIGFGMNYLGLASLISDYAFYSFNFIEDFVDKDDLLKKYVDYIKDIQPEAPYIFFGWSAASRLIFQVTKVLENQGRRVSDIILADSLWIGNQNRVRTEEAKGRYYAEIEEYLERLGADTLKEKVVKKTAKYITYFESVTELEVVDANVHLLVSQETRDMEDVDIHCWDPLTSRTSAIYQGFGTHQAMFDPGILEENSRVIREILQRIESGEGLNN